MQLALNVLIFCCGFAIAIFASLHPKKARADLDRLMTNVNYVFSALRLKPGNSPVGSTKEAGHGAEYLLTVKQVEELYSQDDWQRQVFDEIKAILLAKGDGRKTFPCVYATKGLRDNEHRYVFLPSNDPSEPRCIRVLGEALRAYLAQSRRIGKNTSIVFVTPPSTNELPIAEYQKRFWSTLRALRVYDTKPWPTDTPEDVDSSTWTFCFDGSPVFPVALTPAHQRRESRWAPSFCIALQPKWVFDELLSTPEKRTAATNKVRKLLKAYDTLEPSPDLTAYGDAGTTEAHQLFLLDNNDVQAQCPYEDFDR